MPNAANDACVCPDGQEKIDNRCVASCRDDQTRVGDACECESGKVEVNSGNNKLCIPEDGVLGDTPYIDMAYTASTCRAGGWNALMTVNTRQQQIEICQIPVRLVSVVIANTVDVAAVPKPLNDSPETIVFSRNFDSCLMRGENDGRHIECGTLFNNDNNGTPSALGFPSKSNYGENERIRIRSLNGVKVFQPSRINVNTGDDDSSHRDHGKIIFFSVAAVAFYTFVNYGGDIGSLAWQPHAEYRNDNGSNYYAYGSRLNFEVDNWSGYWNVLQIHSGGDAGDWVYGAGTGWSDGIFSANLRNNSHGLDSDTDFSLSAKKQLGVWTLKTFYVSSFNIHNLNPTWENSINLGGNAVYNKWTVMPRVNFSWQDDKSTNSGVRLDLRREL